MRNETQSFGLMRFEKIGCSGGVAKWRKNPEMAKSRSLGKPPVCSSEVVVMVSLLTKFYLRVFDDGAFVFLRTGIRSTVEHSAEQSTDFFGGIFRGHPHHFFAGAF